ncbi:porin [Photobacterium leiognathi]|uniref:Porin n=1 Tax=Photobacterium leiognathi TaxID=553611 RepID=A0A2T3MBH7_PHOLE|nr:membrane protein [Photobacterium leiognathi]PSV90585.1 porin [Photobacterium leiognathi]
MENMFKRTLLGAAIAAAAMTSISASAEGADAVAIEKLKESFSYEVYGVIAMQALTRDYNEAGKALWAEDSNWKLNNESRIGFRGSKDFANGPKFIWQIESGYVGGSGNAAGDSGKLGVRDTFVGFEGDSWGKIRIGRVLTPIYEIIDWPGSNPGLGDVYDWGYGIAGAAYQDRQSDTVRWDSPTWGGFSVDVAFGRGDAVAEADSNWGGAAAHYAIGPVTLQAAYERNNSSDWINDTYLVGVQGNFENGLGFFAQYKMMEADAQVAGTADESQNAYTAGLMYNIADYQFKVGYAANEDLERDGKKVAYTDDSVISGQVMYFIDPSAVVYTRVRHVERADEAAKRVDNQNPEFMEYSVGVEYYF